jgi:hypothetical protein
MLCLTGRTRSARNRDRMLAAGLPADFVDPCRHTTNRPCAPACIHNEGFQLALLPASAG